MQDETAIYIILKKIRLRKEELKEVVATGLPSWDEYNKTVGQFTAYANNGTGDSRPAERRGKQ
tara:strand:- start:245 stop:433 length:189 start_codon:yes stop_codon:yes gene_type:complete